MAQSLRSLPAGLFGSVMGLAGLGLVSRAAAGLPGLPPHLAELWVALGAAALAVLFAAYLLKAFRYPDAVRDDIANPASVGFCAALPVGMTLVAGGLQPYAADLARALWCTAAVLLVLLQIWTLARWLQGGLDLAQANAGWMILFVGGIVFPSSGLPLGFTEASAWFFGASAVVAPLVMGLVLYRTLFGPPLPPPLRPTSFILVVPPALVYVNGLALGAGSGSFLLGLYFVALVLAAGLLVSARGFLSWPFGASWWAFTFPLDALAAAAVHYAHDHPGGPWQTIAAAALLLAIVVVLLVLARTLLALSRGTLLLPPAAPPTKA